MISKEQLIEVLEFQSKKFLDEKVAKSFSGWNKTMQYHFTDTDEYWNIKLIDGKPQPVQQGKVEKPEIEYQMSTDTFIAIHNKELSPLKAYQQGKVKLKASITDMMKLQKLA